MPDAVDLGENQDDDDAFKAFMLCTKLGSSKAKVEEIVK